MPPPADAASRSAAPPPPGATGGPLGPTAPGERVSSIDTLRGVAVLGIFAMNIWTFALPAAAFFNPPIAGGFAGPDYAVWLAAHVLFDQKMMAIFSLLFGVGIAMMADRAAARGAAPAGVHYRRMGWLLLIGLVHAYVVWFGDILVAYALTGMIVYPLRTLAARWQLVLGACLLPVAMVLSGAQQALFEWMRSGAQAGDAGLADAWAGTREMFFPSAEALQRERETNLGSFVERIEGTAGGVLFMQTYIYAVWVFWRVAGLMLIGMALHRFGVLTAARSTRFYVAMLVCGMVPGLGLIATGVAQMHRLDFDPLAIFGWVGMFNYAGSVGVAIGWIALVMLLCKSGAVGWLRRSLTAVGRMALTNYLAQSVIGAFVFYGWGLGSFGRLSRIELVPIVLIVWALQLLASPLWLHWFRMGPMEWLWRSLTYGRLEPLRRASL